MKFSNISKKNKCIVYAVVCLTIVLLFSVYWKMTEYDRNRNHKIRELNADINESLANGTSLSSVCFWGHDKYVQDEKYIDNIVSQTKMLIEKEKYFLLADVLKEMEYREIYISEIKQLLKACYDNAADFDEVHSLDWRFGRLEWYNSELYLTRSSAIVEKYISQHGTNPVTTDKSKGFYANMEDTYSKHVVGLPTSPLYDASSTKYHGDFKNKIESGVELNRFYQESSYHESTWYFRDNYIIFSPNDGEIVWSGDYLFCFSPSGRLIEFSELDK